MPSEKISQRDQILRFLKSNGSITPVEALRYFGCFRLAARIAEIRGTLGQATVETIMEGEPKHARYVYHGD